MKLAVQRKRTSQEVVLRYVMRTRAAFGVTLPDDNGVRKVIPNLGWGYEGPIDKERHWIHTSDQPHGASSSLNFIKFGVRPMYKEIYEFPGGQTVEEYHYIPERNIDHDKAPNLKYLCAIPKMNFTDNWAGRQYTPVEIPYTEEAAAFFVKVFQTVSMLAFQLDQFENPEFIQMPITAHAKGNGQLQLPPPDFTKKEN